MSTAAPALAATDHRWARRWGWALITMAVLVVYWPLSTFSYGLTHGDALDCWLPWRWFIAQAMQDGHFPLWNPYAQSGYPIHADLQGPAWYPPAIALAGTAGHSLYTLQVLFLAYASIGGIGFMRLVQRLHGDARIALVVGMAYALGGFFTGHQMHFYAVISGAWLPWLLAAQLRLIEQPAWRPAAEAAVFQSLLLTGGNHTFTLIGTWLLLALITVRLVRLWRQGDRTTMWRLIGHEAGFALLTVLMACGTFHAWWEVSPYLARAEGMAREAAAINPFTLRAMGSYVLPYPVGTDARWLGTDPTMANGYVGLIILVFAGLALFRQRSTVENTIAIFGGVCFLASFGEALPVHHWLWATVPGLDLFRFPSYFQWFVALAALVLAAGTMARWQQLRSNWPRVVHAVFGAVVVLLLATLVWAWNKHGAEPQLAVGTALYERLTGLWRWHRVLLAAPVALLAVAGLWWWAIAPRRRWWALLALVVLEMGWATGLAQWNTALGNYAPGALQGRLDGMPSGPVWPDLHPMAGNVSNSVALKYLWRNTTDFEAKPSHDGFNSFWLKDATRLAQDHPGLFEAMKRQPLVYLTDSVVTPDRYDPATVKPQRDSALVVVDSIPSAELLALSATDRYDVAGFDHNGIVLHTRTANPTFALFQQAWYPGWQAIIDGEPARVVRANVACFGTVLPAGGHVLEFRYAKPVLGWLLGLSLGVFLGTCAWLAFTGAAGSLVVRTGVVVLGAAIACSLWAHTPKAQRLPREVRALVKQMEAHPAGPLPVLLNTDRFPAVHGLFGGWPVTPLQAHDLRRPAGWLPAAAPFADRAFWWIDAGLPMAPATRAWLLRHHRVETVLVEGGTVAALLRPAPGALGDTVLHSGAAPAWLAGEQPWTMAYRTPAKALLARAPGYLVVQVDYVAQGASKPQVVVEVRRGDEVIDYESYPLPGGDADTLQAVVVKHLREFRHPDAEVGVYVWNQGPDRVWVKAWSVGTTARDLKKW